MGVEIRESPVSDEEFEAMKQFVHDYLAASVENEDEGGRMRWYPWHSAEYRFNHILNVADLATHIARKEGANVDVTRVAALFHDVAKLDADQDVHADAGATVAGNPCSAYGINSTGLKRRGFEDETIRALRSAWRSIFQSELNIGQALDRLEEEGGLLPEVEEMVAFIRESERGVTT